jgi:transcriptional regulator of aroF, aroG, tyrA and aromatic amino acid transport
MEQMVRDKQFRDDLYYRINVLPINLPPLRERKGDVSVLAEHFMLQLSSILDKSIKGIAPAAMNKLRRHHWPGNVRELRNVIERAAILCTTDIIDTDSVMISFDLEKTLAEVRSQAGGTGGTYTLRALLGFYERQIIEENLGSAGSIRKAAQVLGISHTALLNKLKKYNIVERN